MATVSQKRKTRFMPLDCNKLVFEDFSLQAAMEGIKEINIRDFKNNIEIAETETLDVLENLLEDFSCADLKKEVVDLRNYIKRPHKKKVFKERIIDLLNTDVSTPLCDILNTDVSSPIQELLEIDLVTPLQEAFDNIITLIAVNKQG